MYWIVPTDDPVNMTEFMCDKHNISDKQKHELLNISNTIIKQNYFQFLNTYYLQEKGLAMGSPASSIFSEIYLQYIENTAICGILRHNNIAGYFRYADDTLTVHNKTTTDILYVFNSFHRLMPTMKFTMQNEIDDKINFLDLTIMKEPDKLALNIYRKPTTTDSIIPNDSCHPIEHKLAAIRYLTSRMNTYSLNMANKEKERRVIKHILHNNKYDISSFKQAHQD
jgi:hypothetical protein